MKQPARPRCGREGEVERTALDTTAAAERLGWRAERTIETGLEQTIEAGA